MLSQRSLSLPLGLCHWSPDVNILTFFFIRLLSLLIFFKITFSNIFSGVSNDLDRDQDRHYVGPNLGPNCLHKLSADDKSYSKQGELTSS